MHRVPSYPNHVLHPEVIPSLNDVSDELNKRRNIHSHDPLAAETLETEMPMVHASSLAEELQRAVENRLEDFLLLEELQTIFFLLERFMTEILIKDFHLIV